MVLEVVARFCVESASIRNRFSTTRKPPRIVFIAFERSRYLVVRLLARRRQGAGYSGVEMTISCKHGSLQRSCETCELEVHCAHLERLLREAFATIFYAHYEKQFDTKTRKLMEEIKEVLK